MPKPPTAAQQRYLRTLAARTGTSFTPPRSAADASRQIDALRQREASESADRFADRHAVSSALARVITPAQVRAGQIDAPTIGGES